MGATTYRRPCCSGPSRNNLDSRLCLGSFVFQRRCSPCHLHCNSNDANRVGSGCTRCSETRSVACGRFAERFGASGRFLEVGRDWAIR